MKLLVVDDHALVRAGLRLTLAELGAIELFEAGSAAEALSVADAEGDLDLVLLDLHLPDRHGLEVLAELAERHPALPVIVLSASESRSDMQLALGAGALGFIPKATPARVMLQAVRLVLSGGIYVPPAILDAVTADAAAGDAHRLTPRQLMVLALLVRGDPNKRIATRLGLTEATVKAHVTAVLRALDAGNRTQAAARVQQLGLVLPAVD